MLCIVITCYTNQCFMMIFRSFYMLLSLKTRKFSFVFDLSGYQFAVKLMASKGNLLPEISPLCLFEAQR